MDVGRVKEFAEGLKISLIGAGNVATHLGCAFKKAGADIVSVAARTFSNAEILAEMLGAVALRRVQDTPTDVDIVIIATSDTSVEIVVSELPAFGGIVVHTSGSVELGVLAKYHKFCGVLYPLQTFTRGVHIDMSEVPFFTEASDASVHAAIDKVAGLISNNVYHADSEKRKSLHIAGVFASNFPVYMLQLAQNVLAVEGYPFDVVKPLLKATIEKAIMVGPENALTGPARRGDKVVIDLHESRLSRPDAEIYRVISNAIIKKYHSEQN